MDILQDDGPGAPPWLIFALAACQTLREEPGFHVAPGIVDTVARAAVRRYAAMGPEEVLLVVFDPSSGNPSAAGCALTSRRVCWPGGSVGYADLPETVRVSARLTGSSIDLGRNNALTLQRADGRALESLARVLDVLGRGARTGNLGGTLSNAALDEARHHVAAVLVESDVYRRLARAAPTFGEQVSRAAPWVVVTPAVIAACVLVFVAMVLSGVSPATPDAQSLFAWGGNEGAAVAFNDDAWRLVTGTFLHGGLIHLALNLWCLASVGPLVERLYGSPGFAALYLAAGVGGSLVSAWWHPLVVGVGASGAIFGVIGGLLAFLTVHRNAIPAAVFGRLRASTLAFVGYNVLPGFLFTGIDNAAHLGGLATGVVAGLMLTRPWPVSRPGAGLLRQAAGAVLIALALTGAWVGVKAMVRRNPEVVSAEVARPAISPATALNALMHELQVPLDGFFQRKTRFAALVQQIDQTGVDPTSHRHLDALIAETETALHSADTIETPDPALDAIRRRYVQAETEFLGALKSLRRYLNNPSDRAAIDGPDGFKISQEHSDRAIQQFLSLRQDYVQDHHLTTVPEAEPER